MGKEKEKSYFLEIYDTRYKMVQRLSFGKINGSGRCCNAYIYWTSQ